MANTGYLKLNKKDLVTVIQEETANKLTQSEADNLYLGKTDKAVSAGSADSATKATRDANGNVITSTYATKAEAVRSINNTSPDKNGNITPAQTGCLPLSGGTMTGGILFKNGAQIRTAGSPDAYYLTLFGVAGNFNSSMLALSSENNRDPNFTLNAGNGTVAKTLTGKVDGSLKWDNKEIERVNAIGENYIRYESGLQICWGSVLIQPGNKNIEVLLPVPYTSYEDFVSFAIYDDINNGQTCVTTANSRSNNKLVIMCATINDTYDWLRGVYWLTIGKWK